MALTKRLGRVGNSVGLTLDRAVLKQVGWELGTEVEIKVEGNTIVLKACRPGPPAGVFDSVRRMIGRRTG